jgi:hypothetical protein
VNLTIAEAARLLEARGDLKRLRVDNSAKIIEGVSEHIGQEIHDDLKALYRECIAEINDFAAIVPKWNDRVGWRDEMHRVGRLLHARAIPIFSDGCGNFFGMSLDAVTRPPEVYFFDQMHDYAWPSYATGSTIARALMLLADDDRAIHEGWPSKWELAVDPDLGNCPRAPAIWDLDPL